MGCGEWSDGAAEEVRDEASALIEEKEKLKGVTNGPRMLAIQGKLLL